MTERRVLIVDDDEGIRLSLRFLLESESYLVEEAGTGEAAVQAIASAPHPLVVLLDRMMPKGDGASVLTAVRAEPTWRPRLAIIFMTARSDAPSHELADLLTQTTVAIIMKPFDLDQVVATTADAWNSLVISPT